MSMSPPEAKKLKINHGPNHDQTSLVLSTKILKILGLVATFIATAFLAFQYFIYADFPIGHDVILHIARSLQIEQQGLLSAFSNSVYPLSAIIFVYWHKLFALFGLSWEKTFIFVECFYLFLTALLSGLLAYRLFKSRLTAALAALFVACSRWLNDSLRIGLMAESLGWVFFVLALILLFEKKWLWLAIVVILLFLSHPIPLTVFLVVAFVTGLYWAMAKEKHSRYLLILLPTIILAIMGIIYYFFPDLWQTLLKFSHLKFRPEGERSFINYITDWDKRRMLLYFLAFFGMLFLLIKRWREEKIRLLIIFTIISFFFCFKHYLGIHYLGFRFYTYFEIASAILAAYGLITIAQLIWAKRSWLVFLPVGLMLIYPNWSATKEITAWQLSDFPRNDATPVADRQALKEINPLLVPSSPIYTHSYWAWWLMLDGHPVFSDWLNYPDKLIYQTHNIPDFIQFLHQKNIQYIYFSSIDPPAQLEETSYLQLIYIHNNVRVYEIK